MIKAENLFKSYNGGLIRALDGVSLEIEDGSFTAVLGPSGSGKSTLMNVLSGLERADGGKAVCGGYILNEMTDRQLTEFRRQKVGFVFQQYYLLPHLNVLKNVKMGAELAGNKDFEDILVSLGLKDKLKAMPYELSGGEQQRVCIARALAKKPEILFLDEPTGALDEKTGREVLDCMLKEKAERGFTAVMVTHNSNIAELCSSVIKMNSGKTERIYKNACVKSAYEIGW